MRKRGKVFKTRYVIAFRVWLSVITLCLGLFLNQGQVVAANTTQVKELNFVFLHGLGSTSATTQLLADIIEEQAKIYAASYEQVNPGITVRVNTFQRSYPNNVDVVTWANNVADAIKVRFAGKKNLILIGHSMGGKAALYAVAHNIQSLGDITSMVVTINSPVKNLSAYHLTGGDFVSNFIRQGGLIYDQKVTNSLGYYDSSADGLQIGTNKHWLAFISAESAPLSPQYDQPGVDPFPRDMDDGAVPISAQYSAGADTVYYGEYKHGDFETKPSVAGIIADRILRYLFGGTIEVPSLNFQGAFEHHAGWSPLTYRWYDRFGEFPGVSGNISHNNNSFYRWQEWEDIVRGCSPGTLSERYDVRLISFPLLSSISEVRWLNPSDPADCRLYLKTRAAPKSFVRVNWNTAQYQQLPSGFKRSHYEIEVTTSTSLTVIPQASWLTKDMADTRLQVWSRAAGPFHWFKAELRMYYQQTIQRKVIDEIPSQPLS